MPLLEGRDASGGSRAGLGAAEVLEVGEEPVHGDGGAAARCGEEVEHEGRVARGEEHLDEVVAGAELGEVAGGGERVHHHHAHPHSTLPLVDALMCIRRQHLLQRLLEVASELTRSRPSAVDDALANLLRHLHNLLCLDLTRCHHRHQRPPRSSPQWGATRENAALLEHFRCSEVIRVEQPAYAEREPSLEFEDFFASRASSAGFALGR
mmetsp:Transcript_6185/g.12205  ORF Transcript_6185/g.12205 Transcript_6185/m.12205 type:complete len:209 (-) Transcript_6185:754-1380(-)